jgi:hypothetical protein
MAATGTIRPGVLAAGTAVPPLDRARALVGPTHQAAVDQFLPEARLIAGYPSGW